MIFSEIFAYPGINSISIQYAKIYFSLYHPNRVSCKFMITIKVLIAPNSAVAVFQIPAVSPAPVPSLEEAFLIVRLFKKQL